MATALVFFHKFFMLHSFLKHERLFVASACLFLAAKVEVRDVSGRRFQMNNFVPGTRTHYSYSRNRYLLCETSLGRRGGQSGVRLLITAAAFRGIGGISPSSPPRRRVEYGMAVAS